MTRLSSLLVLATGVFAALGASCGKGGPGADPADAASGGAGSSGGAGGQPRTGGAGTGGAPATGGAGNGGAPATGGIGSGGAPATGGTPGSGGAGAMDVRPAGDAVPEAGGPSGCTPAPALKLIRAAKLAQSATTLVQAPGDPRMFIAERPGRILILTGGAVSPMPFMDLRPSVAPLETERGLLSIALHPQFAANRRFYLAYTRSANDPLTPGLSTLGDLVLAEGTASTADPNRADPGVKILRTVPKAVRFHNGGAIAFGPDGMLYMGTGEDGRQYNPGQRPSLQQLNNAWGKLLRIDVDNPTARPAGNVPSGDVHVWDYGLRNPWRLSFDRVTGDLYIADVGEATWEEIIFEPKGTGQRNYGWPIMEGNHCSVYAPGCNMQGLTGALHELAHTGMGAGAGGVCPFDDEKPIDCNRAVVGGHVYRGRAVPELDGRYFYGEHMHNQVMSLVVKNGAATCHADHTTDLTTPQTPIQGLISFAQDAQGEVYLLDLFGNVYRIDRE
jgi:glucose/arabinose dehydrogenase